MQNKKVVLLSILGLIIAFIVGGVVYKNNQEASYEKLAKQKASLYQRDYSIVFGAKDAKVQLVEFFDPACGTCAQFHSITKKILKDNDGDVKLVLRYAPFHKNSVYAVKMLEAARMQGKFLETLEFMFATQRYWINNHVVDPQRLWNMLPKVGLDMKELAKNMENPKFDEIIKQDLADAKALDARKTPAYYINGKPLQTFGEKPLLQMIEDEL